MGSWQAHLCSALLRQTFKRTLAAANNVGAARTLLNSNRYPTPPDVLVLAHRIGGVAGEWVLPRTAASRGTLLYLHGGGYFACSPRTHRAATSYLARYGWRVFAPHYRLAPEHPFPSAIDDAKAAYLGLLQADCDPARLVVAGDSAGGGLALSLLLRLRETGLPQPAAAALFSPLTDLALTGESLQANRERCAMFVAERIVFCADLYLAGADPRTPLASPLYANLAGLPPLLVHVGADEILRDDATRLAQRAQAAGVPVELRIWPAVPHVWQLFHWFVPEGRESLDAANAFLNRMAAGGTAGAPTQRIKRIAPRPLRTGGQA